MGIDSVTQQISTGQFDEIRVITLPPPITAAVNRLLREEEGWRLLDARVTERRLMTGGDVDTQISVVYVLGHVASGVGGQEG